MVAAALNPSTSASGEHQKEAMMTMTQTTQTTTAKKVDDSSSSLPAALLLSENGEEKKDFAGAATMEAHPIVNISSSTIIETQQRKRKAGELPIKTKFMSSSTLRGGGEDGSRMAIGGELTTTPNIVAAEFDENGVRKSKRSVKPKILFDDTEDYERINTYERPGSSNKKKKGNSSKNNNNKENSTTKKRKMGSNAGAATSKADASVVKIDFEELRAKRAYIGKKVEVFWNGEQEYHQGTIVNYDHVVKKHCVKYDRVKKSDRENEAMLDFIDIETDTLEWRDEDEEEDDKNNTKTKKSKSKVTLPAQGKMSEIVAQLPESWPKVGAHVWGRVKGHGWWPGVCKGKESATSRTIAFFDDSMAKVLRADLVPYNAFFDVLKKSKASKSYENAVKRSMESAEKHFSEKLKKRVAKKQEGFAEIRKKYAAVEKKRQSQEQQAASAKNNKSMQNNNKNKRGKAKHNNTNKVVKNNSNNTAGFFASVDLNGNSSAARLARLGKHFDALKDRVAPLAIAASQHLRVQLQLQENSGGANRMAQMTERERVVLLEELDTLKSFLVNAGRHLEVINAENPEDVAMFGYDDDFDNQIANATFMTVGEDNDIICKTGEEENLDDPDEVEDDDDVIVDDDMMNDLGLSADDIADEDDGDGETTKDLEDPTNIVDALDPTPLDALLFQEEKEEDGREEQPKTPHYPTRDEEKGNQHELKHTSSDDRTERNDSDDNDASLPNENSKSIGGDAKDQDEEVLKGTSVIPLQGDKTATTTS
jgi:hypothetical protein